MEEEFIRRLWEKYKPKHMKFLEVKNLYNYFLELCDIFHIDPKTIDFESIIDWSLSYEENKKLLERFFPILEEERISAMEESLKKAYEAKEESRYLELLKELREIKEKLKETVTRREFAEIRKIIDRLSHLWEVVSRLSEEARRIEKVSRKMEEFFLREEEAEELRREKTEAILNGFIDYLKKISEFLPYFTVVSVRKGIPRELSHIIGPLSLSYSVILDIASVDLGLLDRDVLRQVLEYIAEGDLESAARLNIYSDIYVSKGPTKKAGMVDENPRVLPVFSPDLPGYAVFWIDRAEIEDFDYLEDNPVERIIYALASKLLYYVFHLDSKDWDLVEDRRKTYLLFKNGFIIYRLKDDPTYRKALDKLLEIKLPVVDNPSKLELWIPTVYEEIETLPLIRELQKEFGGKIEIVSEDKAKERLKEGWGVYER